MPQMYCSTEHIQHNVGSALAGTIILLLLLFEAPGSDIDWAKVFYAPAPNTERTLHAVVFSLAGCTLGLLVCSPLK